MPRKPITEYIGGKGPRQHIWEAIRRLAEKSAAFTERDIHAAIAHAARAGMEMDVISDYRRALVAGGVLSLHSKANKARHIPATYLLARNEGLEAPRLRRDGSRVTQGLAQEQMWRTLRMLTADTNARELAAHASTSANPVSETAASDYLLTLFQAGYLTRTKEGKGTGNGGVMARYRLNPTRNTGPRPPMVCRSQVVYDPNEDKVVWAKPVTDEDAIHAR